MTNDGEEQKRTTTTRSDVTNPNPNPNPNHAVEPPNRLESSFGKDRNSGLHIRGCHSGMKFGDGRDPDSASQPGLKSQGGSLFPGDGL